VKLKRRQKNPERIENDLPTISVIVAAYDEENVIEEKIKNTLALDYPKDKIEILIGSDGSEDRTDEICEAYSDVIKFRRIEPRQGKSNVLNTLVPQAKGEILLFSDANSILQKDSLRKLVPHFVDPSIGGVCGRLILESRTASVEAFEKTYWKYESDIKNLESKIHSTVGANGGIYAIRKKLFQPIPKDTIIDDFWISMNILEQDKRIYFEKEATAKEYISDNVIDEFWRKVRIGSGNLQTFLRRPMIRNQTIGFAQVAYYSHKVIRWLTPFFLCALYLSLVSLSRQSGFTIIFYVANLLILTSLLSVVFETRNKTINLIGYFCLFNLALLFGYIRYLMGRQGATWRRATRSSKKPEKN
jgi:cellulose synthase/poly-beta-1,6-N-acetylglucosamine synthase-like glycosyltransferase